MKDTQQPCAICNQIEWKFHAFFTQKPDIEADYGFQRYQRSLFECQTCGHFENRYGGDIDLSSLYEGGYWDSTYADQVKSTFDRIMSLPADQSDNRGRVDFINRFWEQNALLKKTVLDIGSGLAVFPAVMKETGWEVTALDPDAKAAEHARNNANVKSVAADYLKDNVDGKYTLVTLNKVLEHVPDMTGMLNKVKHNLSKDGLVYVELPDGETAIHDPDNATREEFLVEHYCAFSFASYSLLASKAGFNVLTLERLIEPSGKYTLRGFLKVKDNA
ncbi:class I SAM-dependent methyltransferase [Curvivirga aplysinae]|uniref:class I SAM-dependent methyltransferase n=1 Tax=Curvivirga aplysinae TaxID=2529852 RepID=UPI0012BCD62E|nr:class I SAM-dependent methyltransferase [Curvivirga aplysinae]MTI10576.1 class I SAM-dependent methyltransferase [Curvivirga aplysinae]